MHLATRLLIWGAVLIWGFLFSVCYASEKVHVEADHFFYQEDKKMLVATSNVILSHKDVHIDSEFIQLNTSTNVVISTGDIDVTYDGNDINSTYLTFDLDTNTLSMKELDMAISSFGNDKDKLFLKADTIEDTGDYHVGQNAQFTTCDYSDPHYTFSAKHFTYERGNRFVGQDTLLLDPLHPFLRPIPFLGWTWSPFYIFELGKRQVVYLMPIVGENSAEGFFFKSTFDYYFSRSRHGKVYVDIMKKKGIGLGIDHGYMLGDNMEGSLYYYGITNLPDYNAKWSQTTTLSDTLTFQHDILSRDIFNLSGGFSKSNTQQFTLVSDDLGDYHKLYYKNHNNLSLSSQSKSVNFSYARLYNSRKEWGIDYTRTDSTKRQDTLTLLENHALPFDLTLSNTFSFVNQETDQSVFDRNLQQSTKLSQSIPYGTMTTEVSKFYDIDEETVTSDFSNHYNKLPEITFKANQFSYAGFKFNETFVFGDYEEFFQLAGTAEPKVTRAKRYFLTQQLSKSHELFWKINLSFSETYKQYLYSTGDQFYTINWNGGLKADWWNFFIWDYKYSRSYLGRDFKTSSLGETPFYQVDSANQTEIDRFNESYTFYYDSPSKYKAVITTGYDAVSLRKLDFTYELNAQPNSRIQFNSKTKYLVLDDRYDPLISFFKLSDELRNHSLTMTFKHDINNGDLLEQTNRFSTKFGGSWQSTWELAGYFTLISPLTNPTYQFQTIELVKDLHCRELKISYNRLMEEIRFMYTINAFPDDSVTVIKNKNVDLKLEGIFDDSSVDRL